MGKSFHWFSPVNVSVENSLVKKKKKRKRKERERETRLSTPFEKVMFSPNSNLTNQWSFNFGGKIWAMKNLKETGEN